MVMAQPLVAALRRDGAEVHVLAPPATLPIAARLAGVTRAHCLQAGHGALALKARWRAARALRGLRFGRAIVLPNSFKSALTPWFARIPVRTGWRGEHRHGVLNDLRRPDAATPRLVDRFSALAATTGAEPTHHPCRRPKLLADPRNRTALCAKLGLDPTRPVVALCPGAQFGPAKRWPAKHFAAVAAHSLASERQVWLFGAPNEAPICDEVAARASGSLNLAGRVGLADAIDLLSLAECVVANDSGLMHVAGALGRPVVALFGSTSPSATPPLGPAATVLSTDEPCSPCFERVCPLGHTRCLTELVPQRVCEALDALLAERQRASS